jgi:hypothetical protein
MPVGADQLSQAHAHVSAGVLWCQSRLLFPFKISKEIVLQRAPVGPRPKARSQQEWARTQLELEGELDEAGTSDPVKRAETASEAKGRRSPDDRVLHSPLRTSAGVLRGKGQEVQRRWFVESLDSWRNSMFVQWDRLGWLSFETTGSSPSADSLGV